MAYDMDMVSDAVGPSSNFSDTPIVLTDEEINTVSGGMPLAIIALAIGCAFLLAHD